MDRRRWMLRACGLALVGFLPPDDPRIIGTIEAIQEESDEGWVGAAVQHGEDARMD